jgi:hypothetical protein
MANSGPVDAGARTGFDCDADLYDCSDFATQWEAQQCFDSCWVVTGRDVHNLDADWDFVACEHLPSDALPMDQKVAYWSR